MSPTQKKRLRKKLITEGIRRNVYVPATPAVEEVEEQLPPPQGYREWLSRFFARVAKFALGVRHTRLWEWVENLRPDVKPRARIEIWPRGSAKSTTAELAVAYVGEKLTRRFVLYCCATQDQADDHVQNIATLFERRGIGRLLGQYGTSRGWKRSQLRTENGFNVVAVGLDKAVRGIKLDEFRPDWIIFDDIDEEDDTPKTVAKKIRAVTSKILAAGSIDVAVLFIQNLIHEGGIANKLVERTADFLLNADVPTPEPAVVGLQVERVQGEDGAYSYKITGGTATWEGQSIETCEGQINEYGYETFLKECQHEVKGAGGVFFHEERIRIIELEDVPKFIRLVRSYDFGATEGGGDYSASSPIGITKAGVVVMLDLWHEQVSSDTARQVYETNAVEDRQRYGSLTITIPQDPGQAGKGQAEQLAARLPNDVVKPYLRQGKKYIHAKTLQEKVNLGNFWMVRGTWNAVALRELRLFREDESHEHDDIVDELADGVNELAYSGWASSGANLEEVAGWWHAEPTPEDESEPAGVA